MINKLNVAVMMGGRSSEYEVSLMSGREIVKNLDVNKYNILPIVISKDGKVWKLISKEQLLLDIESSKKQLAKLEKKEIINLDNMMERDIDIAFVAMHGAFGEDGKIQGLLDCANIKYTGSGVLASALGMDKILFRKVLEAEKFPVPKYVVVEKGEDVNKISEVLGKPPYFVKPYNQGSSVGASIVRNKKDLKKALSLSFKYSRYSLVDEYIDGLELTCGVLGNETPQALPVIEIKPLKGQFFDYASKYTENGAEEIVPAPISKELTDKIQNLAVGVHKLIGCKGFSRVDFLIKDKVCPVVLEINTIPGLTPFSLLPKSANALGITYSMLLDKIIMYGLE